jgi:hypothetical protein
MRGEQRLRRSCSGSRRRSLYMSTEFTVAIVAGLFGLVPFMAQIVSRRAQRRDRMTRLNQLRAELELLERLHTLQGEVSATDEATKPPTNVVIRDALRKVLDQYNKLAEIAPSTVVGRKPPSTQQLSFFRRAFLLYNPHTISGWILHTLLHDRYHLCVLLYQSTLRVLLSSFYRDKTFISGGLCRWVWYSTTNPPTPSPTQRGSQRCSVRGAQRLTRRTSENTYSTHSAE